MGRLGEVPARYGSMYITTQRRRPWGYCLWLWATDDRHRFIRMLFLSIALIFGAVLGLSAALPQATRYASYTKQPLRFTRNGTFHIAIFEDLHFGESMLGLPQLVLDYMLLTVLAQTRGINGVPNKMSIPSRS